MSTKFFTNHKGDTLLDKFEGVFKYRSNIVYFDALVGYLRASGYFKLRKALEPLEQIRILVGIDVDRLTAKYAQRGLEMRFVGDDARADFIQKTINDIQQADYEQDVEEGIQAFFQDVSTSRIQIKAHPSKRIHAKLYIFREKEKHAHGYGTVITGSSNLSAFGLEDSFEFNVELRDNDDIQFATETFEELWEEGIKILPTQLEPIKEKTFLNDSFSPFEIYIKMLQTYFGDAVNYDPSVAEDLPEKYKRLSYQVDAVNDGFNKLKAHGGFILADVVGLGKTLVATMVARKFYFTNGAPTRTLVICPPALKDSWESTLRDFSLPDYKIFTSGSLHKVKYPESYHLVIVDEAHKFRSDKSKGFDALQKICKTACKTTGNIITRNNRRKRVILISATPLNNYPEDLRNLVYLFQDSRQATLEIGNLQHFFAPLIEEYKVLKKKKNMDEIKEGIKAIYEKIRLQVLQPLTVRRTRTDILETATYAEDIKKQGVQFPAIHPPRKVLYELGEELEQLYDLTIEHISHKLTYARYQAIAALRPELRRKFKNARQISAQLAKIMKTLLLKRLDSSFTALHSSFKRFSAANGAMIQMFENDRVVLAPSLKGAKITEYILDDDEESLEIIVDKLQEEGKNAMICKADDFSEEFLESLHYDQQLLEELVEEWGKVKEDPKLQTFIQQLNTQFLDKKANPEQKLVVFSESAETTTYIKEELQKAGRKDVLAVTSANRDNVMPKIRDNFDANHPPSKQKNEYNIIVATEVLAEGVNLHRSNTIVNYDTPWNSTRLMQRIGRVNRVGSKAPNVYVYNFFPTAKVEADIELRKRAIMKLQAFHSALGEDSQIYSDVEEVESFGLFEDLPTEERDQRLPFLMELRAYKEKYPEDYKRILALPLRARVGRKNQERHLQTLSYLKNEQRDGFFLVNQNGNLQELTFPQAAAIYKASVKEKGTSLHSFHHEQVLEALKRFEAEQRLKIQQNIGVDTTKSPIENKALKVLSGVLMQKKLLTKEEITIFESAKEAIQKGRFAQLPIAINRLYKKAKKEKLSPALLIDALKETVMPYYDSAMQEAKEQDEQLLMDSPQIIISQSFNA